MYESHGSHAEQTVRVVLGRTTGHISAAELGARIARHREVVVDLGTGDGRFALDCARARPDALVIGVDPVGEAMAHAAARAVRKPARGGAANACFVVASLERMPAVLRGAATELTLNYPWGSLLRAAGWPQPEGLATIAGLLAPGGRVTTLLNASAAQRTQHAIRLDLPPLDASHVRSELVPGWQAAGLEAVSWRHLPAGEEPPHRTTWGQRLVRGSQRETLLVAARRPLAHAA